MAASNLLTSGLTIPPAAALNAAASGPRGLAAAGARSLVPLIYGRDRVPALILNVLAKAGDATIVLVQCLWSHALDAVESVTYNDQALPAGATVTHYTGSQTTADADLVAAFAAQSITYTDTLAGYGYSVVALPAAKFDGQLNFGALVRGRRVYDPRQDSTAGGAGSQRLANPATWAWSVNPSLALADWLASTLYGAGLAVDWTSVGPAANANDATVGSPAEPRRQLGLTIARDGVTVAALGEALRAYAGCWLVPSAGGMKLLPDADAAAVASYNHGSGQIAQLRDVTLRDMGSSPTAVEIQYTDTSQVPWRDASATATLPGAGTTRPWRLSTVAMPGVQRYSQANREAIERLNKLTLGDLSLTLEVFDEGLRHEQADIVTLTHPVGLVAKPMRVMGVEMSAPGRWVLELTEHDPAAYSTVVQTAPSILDTTRVPPDGPSQAVASFAGTVNKGRIVWTWAPCSDIAYGWTELRTSDADWGAISPAPVFRGAANTWGQVVTVAAAVTLYARHFGVRGNSSAISVAATVTVLAGDLVQDGAPGAAGAPGPAGATGATGATGAAGAAGASGTQAAVVYLYQWSTTAPGSPTGTTTFTWATAVNSSYSGGAGWQVTVPANPGTTGIKLWVATKQVSAAATTTSSSVDWTSGVTVAAWTSNGTDGAAGAAGAAGVQSATPTVYQWAVSVPAGPTGASTYTWATGAFGAAPSGWTLTPGTSPSAGFTLWGAAVNVTDAATSATTGFNWSSASITARGYAGSDGSAGASAKAIDLAASSQVFQIPKTGSVTPASITFTATGQNLAGSPTFSVLSGTATLAGSGATRTLAFADLVTDSATVQLAQDGLTDTITVVKVREGADAYTILLSNQAHTLPAGPTGGATSYVGAETYLTILKGEVDDTANWSISSADIGLDSIRSATQGGSASGTGRWWRVVTQNVDLGTVAISVSKGALTLAAVFSCQLARSGAAGGAGSAGASSRMCYARVPGNPAPTSGFVTTSGSSSFPSAGESNTTWGINLAWAAADPNPSSTDTLYQADGIFNPATGNTVWATPYISSLKVGTLSAITVNTGALTVQDLVTIGTTGAIRGGSSGYLGGTVFMGYDAGAYKISAGNSTTGIGWNGSALNVYGGTITGSVVQTAASGQRIVLNESGSNVARFYGNGGAGEELMATIGTVAWTEGGFAAASFGSHSTGNTYYGLVARAGSSVAVRGSAISGIGVFGTSASSTGVSGSSGGSAPGVFGISNSGPGARFDRAVEVAASGVSPDPYGALSVTMPSGANYSYIGLTRSANFVFAMGIDTSNRLWFGNASAGYAGTQSGTPAMQLTGPGAVQFAAGFGCNGNAAQGKYTVNAACFDEATAVALVNQIRTALINNGICI